MGRNRKGKWEEISFWAVERTKRTGLYYSKINEVRKFIKIQTAVELIAKVDCEISVLKNVF